MNSGLKQASALAALGVVFGDIGTSPLYAFRAAIGAAGVAEAEAITGIASMIFWALTLVVTVKYVAFVLREDNEGEGGILALAARIGLHHRAIGRRARVLLVVAVCGAALLFGDAVITPAISVLSAIEGLSDLSPVFIAWEVPFAVAILLCLFTFQTFGTARISHVFGPVMLIWFGVLAASGIPAIIAAPEILRALSPIPALGFAVAHPAVVLAVIGAVFLAVTGAEALYADLGQFGRRSISRAWFFAAFPALVINYFGQGALVVAHPQVLTDEVSTFYALFPIALQPGAIGLATLAAIIASQAVITGIFSLANQAISMGLLPPLRLVPKNTSNLHDMFVPSVNVVLAVVSIIIVMEFRTADALANAYGVAVAGAMVTTTILYVARRFTMLSTATASLWPAAAIGVALLLLDGMFVLAGSDKLVSGGAVPLTLSAVVVIISFSWRIGQDRIAEVSRTLVRPVPMPEPVILEKTAVFLSRRFGHMPRTYYELRASPGIVFARAICVHLTTSDRPTAAECPAQIRTDGPVTFVDLQIGFMETVALPERLSKALLWDDTDDLVFIVGSEHSVAPQHLRSAKDLMLALYCPMERLAGRRTDRLGLPPKATLEFSTIWQL